MAPNKYLQLPDQGQGLSAFVFEKEDGKPILRDGLLHDYVYFHAEAFDACAEA